METRFSEFSKELGKNKVESERREGELNSRLERVEGGFIEIKSLLKGLQTQRVMVEDSVLNSDNSSRSSALSMVLIQPWQVLLSLNPQLY